MEHHERNRPCRIFRICTAHLWLAENAGNVEGQYFIAEPVRISHLLSAVAGLRGSGDLTARARSLLARCLLNSAEPQLAMWQLEAAADKDPRYLLELGAIQALRGKSLKGDHRLQAYREVLLKTLKANPKHVTDHTETAVFAARTHFYSKNLRSPLPSFAVRFRIPAALKFTSFWRMSQHGSHAVSGIQKPSILPQCLRCCRKQILSNPPIPPHFSCS